MLPKIKVFSKYRKINVVVYVFCRSNQNREDGNNDEEEEKKMLFSFFLFSPSFWSHVN